jgi:hypothetical protein
MMPNDLARETERFAELLGRKSLALDWNTSVVRRDGHEAIVSWATAVDGRDALFSSATLSEYLRLVADRQFSVLLADGSLIQISATFHHTRLVKHRYCLFPAPIPVAREDLVGMSLVDIIEATPDAELRNVLTLEGPVRFDYDTTAARPGHSACHFTTSRLDTRVPVFGPLSLGHFVQFLANNYFVAWQSEPEVLNWPLRWLERTLTPEDRRLLHIDQAQMPMGGSSRQ